MAAEAAAACSAFHWCLVHRPEQPKSHHELFLHQWLHQQRCFSKNKCPSSLCWMPMWKLKARSYHCYPGWVPYQHACRKQVFSCFSSSSSKEEGISSPVLAKKNYQEKLPWQTDNRYRFPNILVSADTPWNVLTLKTALSLFKIHCFYSFSFGLSFWAFHCK